jgi:hypothetical protein
VTSEFNFYEGATKEESDAIDQTQIEQEMISDK